MAVDEENLFRQFRLPWVPAWVPDWLEVTIRSGVQASAFWKTLALAVMVGLSTYAVWDLLSRQSGETLDDAARWKAQVTAAAPNERPLLFDALFQVQNEGVLAVGIGYLLSPEKELRQAAGMALRDAGDQWKRLSSDEEVRQRDRVLRLLAQVVDSLHSPEQSLAVQLTQETMTRPPSVDPSLRNSILNSTRVILTTANSAYTAGIPLPEMGVNPANNPADNPADNAARRYPFPRGGKETGVSPYGLGDDPRETSVSPDRAGGLVAVSGRDGANLSRFLPAGFSRGGGASTNEGTPQSVAGSALPQPWANTPTSLSQVPLFGDDGRLIEVQALDPALLSAPGGLIPVDMSQGFGNAGLGSNRRSTPNRTGAPPDSSIDGSSPGSQGPAASWQRDRVGSARSGNWTNTEDPMGRTSRGELEFSGDGNGSFGSPEDPSGRRELEAAFRVRSRAVSATNPRGSQNRSNSRDETRSRIVTGSPSNRVLDTAAPGNPGNASNSGSFTTGVGGGGTSRDSGGMTTPANTSGRNSADSFETSNSVAWPQQNDPRPSGTIVGTAPAESRLPPNPYRSGGSSTSSPDANSAEMQRLPPSQEPSAESLALLRDAQSRSMPPNGGRPRPAENTMLWSRLSHIEVMQRLRHPDELMASEAAEELGKRGFNSDYVAVARRLTSPDSRERYQLILDLVAGSRVEPMPFLRWLSNDPDPEVRALALEALEMLNEASLDRSVQADPLGNPPPVPR